MNLSTTPAVVQALNDAGLRRGQYQLWIAHWTYQPHVCSRARCGYDADSTQWTDRALGRNLDESLCLDSFFGVPAAPADPNHYERFDREPRHVGRRVITEVETVREYDRLRSSPVLHAKRLATLRDDCAWLAARIIDVAADQPAPDGTLGLGVFHRSWRVELLLLRADNRRVAV